jgi:hypothetical protein
MFHLVVSVETKNIENESRNNQSESRNILLEQQNKTITLERETIKSNHVTFNSSDNSKHVIDNITIVKAGGPLGLSIVGGSDLSSHPFGVDEPGIFVSKVCMFILSCEKIYNILSNLNTVKPIYSGHLGEIDKMTTIYR